MSFRDEASLQLRVPICSAISFLMKAFTKGKGKTKEVRFDPIFFAASVPARKPTAKDLKDVEEHENDPSDSCAVTKQRRILPS
jgi:hypothetical protein